jgi:hypothetical protein
MERTLHLTDAATTWGEYTLYRERYASTPHLAFMHLVVDEHHSFTVHTNGKVTNQPRMLRPDILPEKTAVITSLMSVDSIYGTKGYAMPYDKTFDESTHAYNVSKCWTYDTGKDVLDAARQITLDAKRCAEELTDRPARRPREPWQTEDQYAAESSEDEEQPCLAWDFALAGMRNPQKVVVRMVCQQAASLGSKLVEALTTMVMQKRAYAEMIIQFNLDFDFEGEFYQLMKFEDSYFYMNQNGDSSLPF